MPFWTRKPRWDVPAFGEVWAYNMTKMVMIAPIKGSKLREWVTIDMTGRVSPYWAGVPDRRYAGLRDWRRIATRLEELDD